MKKILAIAGIAVASVAVGAGSVSADNAKCNWGQLTSDAIAAGFDQGGHASSFAGEPRVGLANVVSQGDLNATCELLS